MKDYIIISNADRDEFEKQVSEKLKEGFEFSGPLVTANDPQEQNICYQTIYTRQMIKKDKQVPRKYAIIAANDENKLAEKVEVKLANGWACQGGVSVYSEHDMDSIWFYQAMVK